jgi:hypothetical protein
MGAITWVEVLGRHGDVEARYRFDSAATPDIRIGRAPDNDVMVDDPHVAPHHVRIAFDEHGALHAEDLGSMNGTWLDHMTPRPKHAALRFEIGKHREFRIGRTHLRVRDASETVAPERFMAPPEPHGKWALALSFIVIAFALIDLWLDLLGEATATHFVVPLVGIATLVLIWASAWALISRIFAAQALYMHHLRIGLTAALVALVYAQLKEYLAYGFALPELQQQDIAGVWLILAGACFFHFRAMHVRNLKLAMGIVGGAVLAAIALQMVTVSETRKLWGQQATLGTLKPPAFRIARPASEQSFFAQADAMKSKLDQARKKPASGAGVFGGFDLEE